MVLFTLFQRLGLPIRVVGIVTEKQSERVGLVWIGNPALHLDLDLDGAVDRPVFIAFTQRLSGAGDSRRQGYCFLADKGFYVVAHGDCVLVGRGVAHILPVETTLRVRLVAPVTWRVAAMSRKLGVSEAEAAVKVAAIDRQRVQFAREHFNKDTTDPSLYDLVLNTERFSVEQCADLIVEALHRLQETAQNKAPEPAS